MIVWSEVALFAVRTERHSVTLYLMVPPEAGDDEVIPFPVQLIQTGKIDIYSVCSDNGTGGRFFRRRPAGIRQVSYFAGTEILPHGDAENHACR